MDISEKTGILYSEAENSKKGREGMLRKTFVELVNKLVTESLELSGLKCHDYATEDTLSNFKRLSKIGKLYRITFDSPYEYALFMTLMKLDRVQNLLKQQKQPKNESVRDTIQDAFNYLMLMYACLNENDDTSRRTP